MIGFINYLAVWGCRTAKCHNRVEKQQKMEKETVYFTDFRASLGEGLPSKLKRLIKRAGIGRIDMDNKFVAIKLHFGELGNISYLRPNYAKAVADVVKESGGKNRIGYQRI